MCTWQATSLSCRAIMLTNVMPVTFVLNVLAWGTKSHHNVFYCVDSWILLKLLKISGISIGLVCLGLHFASCVICLLDCLPRLKPLQRRSALWAQLLIVNILSSLDMTPLTASQQQAILLTCFCHPFRFRHLRKTGSQQPLLHRAYTCSSCK